MAQVEDDTYQTKVFRDAGGDMMVAKSGGEINICSRDTLGVSVITLASVSDAGGVFSVVNLPNCKFIVLSMTSMLVSASFWLTSCYAGDEIFLALEPGSTVGISVGQVVLYRSGCTLRGSTGSTTNTIMMSDVGSATSIPSLHLVAMRDDEWSIVSTTGVVTEA